MNAETKIYSDFIKREKVVVTKDSFQYNFNKVQLQKDDDGKWYAEQDDKCHSKKAAIYWYIKNHLSNF